MQRPLSVFLVEQKTTEVCSLLDFVTTPLTALLRLQGHASLPFPFVSGKACYSEKEIPQMLAGTGILFLLRFLQVSESLQCKILRYSQQTLNQALVGQHVKRNKIFILYHSYTQFKLQSWSHGSCSKYLPPQPLLQSTNGLQLEEGVRRKSERWL